MKIILRGPSGPPSLPSHPPVLFMSCLSLDSRAHSFFWAGPILLFALGLSSDLHSKLFQFPLQPRHKGMNKRGGGREERKKRAGEGRRQRQERDSLSSLPLQTGRGAPCPPLPPLLQLMALPLQLLMALGSVLQELLGLPGLLLKQMPEGGAASAVAPSLCPSPPVPALHCSCCLLAAEEEPLSDGRGALGPKLGAQTILHILQLCFYQFL